MNAAADTGRPGVVTLRRRSNLVKGCRLCFTPSLLASQGAGAGAADLQRFATSELLERGAHCKKGQRGEGRRKTPRFRGVSDADAGNALHGKGRGRGELVPVLPPVLCAAVMGVN